MAWKRILATAGLDETKLAIKLNELLEAKVTKYYQDKSLGDHTDNGTRMRAAELLSELLARRKADLTVHTDVVEIVPAPRPQPAEPAHEG